MARLVGASIGGNAIWAYVDQFGSGRLRGVVIVNQTPKMLNAPDWPYGFHGCNIANAGTLFATDRGRQGGREVRAGAGPTGGAAG